MAKDHLVEAILQEDRRLANAKIMRERRRQDIESLGLDPDKPEPNLAPWTKQE